ncbi:C45 family autoproteolytic acyltransferase/hydolase [Salisediminibacterium halotolerans]|uniref:C45 family autoproteolytic acyltransferase/hydolase n=1 Tax=Salisediminibacterium halotolerans TaxID=517425 RepID=UPI000EAF15EE|nr:C45 family peptidase [Salisediminibacterium halotolerans]RLJ81019.1 putative choloylglycine hydrolase [Actinophytocola xinjiangensis]RPE87891.1 putative choloylglycine hydrolase [Salisediminibacterium halotolerans]TWG37912.1 putative choloylglycine hydrolase [Salisediminibacterium halotolerans]GEL08337.1 choloylglycine hydrolase [Salisediminibacterium halotolerans]
MLIETDVIHGRGDPYDFGVKQGQHVSSLLKDKHLKRRKKSIRQYTVDSKEAKNWITAFSPSLWAELNGMADGLKWSLENVLHEYAGYQQSWVTSGCSSFMANGVYGRNYDYHPKTYDGRFVLWQPSSGQGAAHIGFAQRMAGRMDGMNEHGLAVGYHFVNRLRPGDGFICTTIARLILDSCRSVDEATALLHELPHRFAFNYSLTDRTGKSAVVEASAKGTDERSGKQRLTCTNHFQSENKLIENRNYLTESIGRLDLLNATVTAQSDRNTMFEQLNQLQNGIAKTNYRSWAGTIHTAVYDTKNLQATVGIGPDAAPITIDFKAWLEGEQLFLRKIRGRIPDTLPETEHIQAETHTLH